MNETRLSVWQTTHAILNQNLAPHLGNTGDGPGSSCNRCSRDRIRVATGA